MKQISGEKRALLAREVSYEATRSGGAGGQHVNRTESAVILRWALWTTACFTALEKERLYEKLVTRINSLGQLHLRCEKYRDQLSNKEEVFMLFIDLLERALHIPLPRKKTKPTRSSVRKRLESKKQQSKIKKLRSEKF